ncbi:MAG: sulfite exporter TauE/SafE family protein [Nitrospira sp.]
MDTVVLVLITFVAATVNGALGYGFSSITVPVALLFYTNRILNPALVLIELVINGYVLFMNRDSIPNIWRRVAPILIGLVVGVGIGSYILFLVQPAWIKFVTYFFLLPLILLQAAGIRKPIQAEKAIAIPFGIGIGTSLFGHHDFVVFLLPYSSTIRDTRSKISEQHWESSVSPSLPSQRSRMDSSVSTVPAVWRLFLTSFRASSWVSRSEPT